MADTRLGFVGTLPAGAWSNSTAYKYLDVVTYNGSSYVAKTETVPSGTLPTNTTYWQLMASKGDKGDTGEIISASATITDSFGTPTVVVTAGGTSTERTFAFAFSNLKGNGIESIALQGTSGAEKTYRITFSDGSHFDFVVTDGEVTEESLAETLEDYAKTDGYYEDLTSGSTEEVISNVKITDQEPYTFRTSGGNAEIGSREEDTLVGVSVAFNQLVQNGNFASTSGWNSLYCDISASDNILTATATDTISPFIRRIDITMHQGHKYFVGFDVLPQEGLSAIAIIWKNANSFQVRKTNITSNSWSRIEGIGNCAASSESTDSLYTYFNYNDANTGKVTKFKNYNLVDLTLAFGSDIADYLYTLEQAQAGEGVALAKKLGLNKYLGYNAGTLYSAQTDAHKMTGFNQWDEEWEVGTIDYITGVNTANADMYRSKNYIPLIEGKDYYFTHNTSDVIGLRFYDIEKKYIGSIGMTTNSLMQRGSNTLPDNAMYLRFVNTSRNTYQNDICPFIHWDNSRDGDYEPYVLHNYPIDPVVLRGILKKDADGNIYADGDTYEADGTVTRKYGIVDLGTLTWTMSGSGDTAFFFAYPDSIKSGTWNIISSKYVKAQITSANTVSGMAITTATPPMIRVRDTTYSDATTFKTAMSGVYLIYELAEPTTEQATPFTDPQIVDNWGTEEYPDYAVAQGDREYSVPMGHTTLYPISIRDKVEASADNPSNDGVYILQMSGGKATYIPLIIEDELPTMPTQGDGTYVLKCTVTSGTSSLSWVAE